MATQSNNLMLLDSSGFPRVIDTANDEIAISVPFFMNGGATVGGNLNVTGDIVSTGTVNLTIQDSFIDLGIGNATTTKKAAGFSFSIVQNDGSVTTVGGETITDTVAGNAGTPSAPYLIVDGTTEFAANDILVLTGISDGSDDGLYAVASITVDGDGNGNDYIVLQGVGGTAPSASIPFLQNQVSGKSGESAKAYKANISVLAVADGTNFADSAGNQYPEGSFISIFAEGQSQTAPFNGARTADFTSNGAYSALGAAAANLQSAYNAGNTISTSSGSSKPFQVTINSTSGFSVLASASASGVVKFGDSSSNKINTFTVDAAGAASINGVGLTLEAGSGAFGLQADTHSVIAVAGANQTLDIDSSGALSLNSSGGVINVGNDDIDQDINVGTDGERTINIGNNFAQPNGSVVIAAPTLNFDGSAVTIDAKDAGSINIGTSTDASSDTSPINVGTSATARVITVGNAASTALNLNADDVNVTGATTLDLVAPTIGIGSNTGAGKTINIGASSQSNPINIDAGTGAVTINADAASSINVAGANQDLTLNVSGAISITSGALELGQQRVGISGSAGENLDAGYVVCFVNDGGSSKLFKADAGHASDDNQKVFHAAAKESITSGNSGPLAGLPGTIASLKFKTNPSGATDIGKPVYLYDANGTGADEGKVDLTAPTRSTTVVFRVGFLQSSTADANGNYPVLIQPQYIAKRP